MATSSREKGGSPAELREGFLKAFIEALADLKAITAGLAKIASEKAAESLIAGLSVPRLPDPVEGLRDFLSGFGASVEARNGEEVEVVVKQPCLFALKHCAELCPMPHLSAVYLRTASPGEWVPKRAGKVFVEIGQDGCRFRLVKLGSAASSE